MAATGGAAATIVVRESSVQRDGLFGLLALVFAVAFVRGVHGAATTAGTIAAGTISGVLLVAVLLTWRLVRRQGSRLLVTSQSIALVSNSAKDPTTLDRSAGDQLYFVVRGSGRYRYTALQGGGAGTPLNIQLFSRKRVRAACIAQGWHLD
jgi:hypothetical protein